MAASKIQPIMKEVEELCRRWASSKADCRRSALVAVGLTSLVGVVCWEPFADRLRRLLGYDSRPRRAKRLRRKLKVAVLGGGIGGSTVALWLRDAFGGDEDLDVAIFCDGPVGGRCQSVEFEGQRYEAGASSVSEPSSYLQELMRRFSLKKTYLPSSLPFGIFDGARFRFCSTGLAGAGLATAGGWHLTSRWMASWRLRRTYGFRPLERLKRLRHSFLVSKLASLYRIQKNGAAFATPREMLSCLGYDCLRLSERSAEKSFIREHSLPRAVVTELLEPGLRSGESGGFGGQACSELHALAGLLGVCGGAFFSRHFRVKGGSEQVAQSALEMARPRVIHATSRLVRRIGSGKSHDPSFEVAFDVSAHGEAMKASGPSRPARGGKVEGLFVEAFHVVVIAHPLECSVVTFESCCGSNVESRASAPNPACFRRSVAHLVHGTLDLRHFCMEDVAEGDVEVPQVIVPSSIPAQVYTTSDSKAPWFYIGLQFPVAASSREMYAMAASAARGVPQVYKVFAPRPLTENEIRTWLCKMRSSMPVRVIDWYAYPQHTAPQNFKPFVLDAAGVFYVNAIEQVTSSLEMSLIGARNTVNLVLDWVDQRRGPMGF